jgi:glycosyltransferase involved in cell wall biosynthesis
MWRVWQPFWALHERGYPVAWAPGEALTPGSGAGWYQLHLIQRAGALPHQRAPMARWFGRMRDAGKTVVYECDDDLFTPFAPRQLKRRAPRGKSLQALEEERLGALWVLERCDGVTVTTQALASTVRRFTDAPVEVVPNAPDVAWFDRLRPLARRTIPPPTIGWAGGGRPDADLEQMGEAWRRIARRHPAVTFVVLGAKDDVLARYVPADRLVRLPWVNVLEYPLGLVDLDIGCCPLEDQPFNRCKSPIKAWEYALMGAAVVASPAVYSRVIRDGENGLLPATAEGWEWALSQLLEDDERRRAYQAALERDVRTRWSLEANLWRWPAAWNRLWRGER